MKEDTRNLRHILRSLRRVYRRLEAEAELAGPDELSSLATVMQKIAKSMLDYTMAIRNPELVEISSEKAKTDLAMLIQEADNAGKTLLMAQKGPHVKSTKRVTMVHKDFR